MLHRLHHVPRAAAAGGRAASATQEETGRRRRRRPARHRARARRGRARRLHARERPPAADHGRRRGESRVFFIYHYFYTTKAFHSF